MAPLSKYGCRLGKMGMGGGKPDLVTGRGGLTSCIREKEDRHVAYKGGIFVREILFKCAPRRFSGRRIPLF